MQMVGRTSVISLGQESAHRYGSLLGESGMSPLCEESCITHSRCHPCNCQIRKFKHEDLKKKTGKRSAPYRKAITSRSPTFSVALLLGLAY
jgi:hypothetical protein